MCQPDSCPRALTIAADSSSRCEEPVNNIMSKPYKKANDDTPEALDAAAKNYQLLIDQWCKCDAQNLHEIAYYRDPHTGSHGWMCCKCHGIVQTG